MFGVETQPGRVLSNGNSGGASRFFYCAAPSPENPVSLGGFSDTSPKLSQAVGGYRFFYCAKASRKERERGLEGLDERAAEERHAYSGLPDQRMDHEQARRSARNHHPTVKPVALMRWLVRLVTPPGGLVLDPFAGSGTTGIACAHEGFEFVGIEQDAEYAEIAEKRIAATPLSLLGTAPNQSEDRGTPDA
jgi:site-specific DNA-methyltransferase (adenine-specific)